MNPRVNRGSHGHVLVCHSHALLVSLDAPVTGKGAIERLSEARAAFPGFI